MCLTRDRLEPSKDLSCKDNASTSNHLSLIACNNSWISLHPLCSESDWGSTLVVHTDAYAVLEWSNDMKLYIFATKHILWTFNLIWWLCLNLELTPTEIFDIYLVKPKNIFSLNKYQTCVINATSQNSPWHLALTKVNYNSLRLLNEFRMISQALPGQIRKLSKDFNGIYLLKQK